MEIAFAFLFVAMLCWMALAETRLIMQRRRMDKADKRIKKLEEKAK